MNKYKIGVFGSAVLGDKKNIKKAYELGDSLGRYNLIIITGAGTGTPYQIAKQAKRKNKEIELWGFPPVVNESDLKQYTTDDISIYDKLVYIPHNFPFIDNVGSRRQYRNVISTTNCDAGIIFSGRWGTLNEFINLFQTEKVIGVLTGTGEFADELEELNNKIKKPSNAKVIFDDDPEELVKKVLEELDKRD